MKQVFCDIFRAQSYPIKIPHNFTCTDCTVRLLREAEEWGPTYRFWSCANVDVSKQSKCDIINKKY